MAFTLKETPTEREPFKRKDGPKSPADRKFYLSDAAIKRLGGPTGAEIMRLMIEERLTPREVQERLKLSVGEFDTYVLTHYFRREFKAQERLRDFGGDDPKKYSQLQRLKKPKPPPPAIPPIKVDMTLKPGQTPQEWAIGRLNKVTPEAVEKLIYLMRYANQESTQYNAATKLLGLTGIVEVEKSISVIADAEAIIRELNRRAAKPRKELPANDQSIEIEAQEVTELESPQEIELVTNEAGSVESPGESGPAPSLIESLTNVL